MVGPGLYYAQLFKQIQGQFTSLSEKIDFKIKALHKPYSNESYTKSVDFWQEVDVLRDKINNLSNKIKTNKDKINLNLKAYEKAKLTDEELHNRLIKIRERIFP